MTPRDIERADKIILPGVGAFDSAMARLNASGIRDALEEAVLRRGKPVLGVCVGMQIMAGGSEEGTADGLGWIEGAVRKFAIDPLSNRKRLPHMGWNEVVPENTKGLFAGLDPGAMFYFLHSYRFIPSDDGNALATTEYGGRFVSAVGRDAIFGLQFHPEKSHQWGLQVLRNFANI